MNFSVNKYFYLKTFIYYQNNVDLHILSVVTNLMDLVIMYRISAIGNTNSNLELDNSPTTTISKTVMFAKLKGYTIDILEILHDTDGILAPDIKGFIDKSTSFISVYLNRLKDYGLAVKGEMDNWYLTPTGEKFYIYIYKISSLLKKKKKKKTTYKQQTNNRKITRTLNSQKRGPAIDLDRLQKENNLSTDEAVVVGYLAAHYTRTNRKSIEFRDNYDIGDTIGISGMSIDGVISRLRSENLIYTYGKTPVIKYGLIKDFIEMYEY